MAAIRQLTAVKAPHYAVKKLPGAAFRASETDYCQTPHASVWIGPQNTGKGHYCCMGTFDLAAICAMAANERLSEL